MLPFCVPGEREGSRMSWPSMVAALVVPLLCALVYVVWIPHGNAGVHGSQLRLGFAYPLFFRLIKMWSLGESEWPSWRAVIFTGS